MASLAARLRAHPLGAVAVVVSLVVLNAVLHLAPATGLWVSIAASGGLLGFARLTGLSWQQLGLGRAHLRSGLTWAAVVIGVIGTAYLVGILLPWTRTAFLDARYHFDLRSALLTAFLVIPLGTILLEEVAFRSVLWGMLSRHMTTWRVLVVSSTLFGLWHIFPALAFATDRGILQAVPLDHTLVTVAVVLGTVVFTALGGVVAGELRRRSGSVIASAGMHWATNSLGVLFGLVAWRLAG
jgi:membrane protease YdiL (CAAX protease family)